MLSHKRDHYCGLLTREMAGQTVHLSGWVQRTRDLGGVVFVWLRDREGLVQLVFDSADCSPEMLALAQSLRSDCISSFALPPGRSTRPQEPLNSVSPVKSASPQTRLTPPGVCPGVAMT